MSNPQEYTAGFIRDNDGYVLLIQKERGDPAIHGFLNGVGGKVEPTDANFKNAFIREWIEETKLKPKFNWLSIFAYLQGTHESGHRYKICCVGGEYNGLFWDDLCDHDNPLPCSDVGEQFHLEPYDDLSSCYHDLLPQVRYLIPMAFEDRFKTIPTFGYIK